MNRINSNSRITILDYDFLQLSKRTDVWTLGTVNQKLLIISSRLSYFKALGLKVIAINTFNHVIVAVPNLYSKKRSKLSFNKNI